MVGDVEKLEKVHLFIWCYCVDSVVIIRILLNVEFEKVFRMLSEVVCGAFCLVQILAQIFIIVSFSNYVFM